jgi:tRNA (guanine37-N1)-methyltransferase
MIRFHLVTLFKEACEPYLNASILGRAQKAKKISISYQNPRDYVENKWGKVDERPYGGGPGMVMSALPVVKATVKGLMPRGSRVGTGGKKKVIVWFEPGAKQFDNKEADKLAKLSDIVFVCGRYEGIDERARKILKTIAPVKTYAVGEAVYTGGEVPALAMIDAITRRIPGVLGKDASVEERRVASRDVYTRPEIISYKRKKYRVPKVLQTGHHANIDAWKSKKGVNRRNLLSG